MLWKLPLCPMEKETQEKQNLPSQTIQWFIIRVQWLIWANFTSLVEIWETMQSKWGKVWTRPRASQWTVYRRKTPVDRPRTATFMFWGLKLWKVWLRVATWNVSLISLSFSVMVLVDLLLILITIKKTMLYFAFLLHLRTLATNIYTIAFPKLAAKQITSTFSQVGTQK